MTSLLFKINQLKCAYNKNEPVLDISDLEIPKNKLVFVVGKSGVGKSTLIETLGLMNNTIVEGENTSFQFFPKNQSNSIELSDSWRNPEKDLSKFRRDHFSFIFQNTNLMPNFSAGENMIVSLLIRGIKYDEAKREVIKVMNRLSLEPTLFDRSIQELSGGQKQRLAFVRAITADFTVLFGDEPTGNLDEITASELMIVLKELINKENKAGIIVSHDLKLAEKFADIIIPISKTVDSKGNTLGKISSENMLYKKEKNWTSADSTPIYELDTYLGDKIRAEIINTE